MTVDAGGFVGTCDSKAACGGSHFSYPVGYGVGSELAVVESVRGCKMTSLGVS